MIKPVNGYIVLTPIEDTDSVLIGVKSDNKFVGYGKVLFTSDELYPVDSTVLYNKTIGQPWKYNGADVYITTIKSLIGVETND